MKVMIDITVLAKVIFDIIIRYYSILNFIISNYNSIFSLKL